MIAMAQNHSPAAPSRDYRRVLAWTLFLLGVGFGIWGIVIFLTEPLIWDRALTTIAWGLLVWRLALGAASGYPGALVRAARLVERISRALKVNLASEERRFAALGLTGRHHRRSLRRPLPLCL